MNYSDGVDGKYVLEMIVEMKIKISFGTINLVVGERTIIWGTDYFVYILQEMTIVKYYF